MSSEPKEEPQVAEVSKSAELLKEGRRHFICHEYPLAVEKLSEACEILAAEHGDGNEILADSFYSYGEALLEMARMEGPVLGNALKGAEVIDEAGEEAAAEEEKDDKIENESLTDEAKEEIANKVIDALVEAPVVEGKAEPMDTEETKKAEKKDETEKPKTEEAKDDKKEEEESKPEEKKEEETKTEEKKEEDEETKAEEKKEEKEGEENEEEGDEEEEEGEEGEEVEEVEGEETADGEAVEGTEEEKAEDDVGNLQLAWEIIEVARTMYEKRAVKEQDACDKTRLRVADCHRKLAEVMLERDEWQKASEELQKCLDIELSVLKEPNRRVAETHFEMGMAFDHAKSFEDSEKEFQQCISCLKDYQEVLKKKSDKSEDDDKEIAELDDLVKDVRVRCLEIKEQKKAALLAAETSGAGSSSGVTSNGFGSSGTTSNGFSANGTNGASNGHAEGASSASGDKETQDISHLVRKRPKDTEAAGSPLKKVRLSGDKSSETAATPTAAGDAEVS